MSTSKSVFGKPKLKDTPGSSVPSGSATGNPRNKVALKPGHSLMDWIRLGNTGKDLTGVGGVAQEVTLEQLAKHNKTNDAWIALRGKVYNVTHYLDFHPGGADELMQGVGKDATELFNKVHAWVNYESLLMKCFVGRLRRASESNDDLATALFGINKKKIRSNVSAPIVTAVNSTPSTPGSDWFQKLASLTMVFYTRSKSPGFPHVRVKLKDGKEVSVRIRLGSQMFMACRKLESDVTWPCQIDINKDGSKVEIIFMKTTPQLWRDLGEPCDNDGTLCDAPDVSETYLSMNVVSVESVNYNTKLLVLSFSDQTYSTVPLGHHVFVRSEVEGTEVVRPYTPVPPALIRDHTPPSWRVDCLCLMVKSYPMGVLSSWLCGLRPGQTVPVSEPQGSFHPNFLMNCTHLYLVAAGTGLTPMLGLIHWALGARSKCQKVSLMFLNRTLADILWKDQMEQLAAEDSRFSVLHVLSDAVADWEGQRGRIDLSLLQNFLPSTVPDAASPPSCFICVCGPTAFTELTEKLLQELGYVASHYHCFQG
ncbi:cytochrome b5 reductase 4 [Anabrus simplex]|uniref:cytochrome b5 reductase 4 n=1 Tax=Anabrus simplex TaxID=316456 RepID=UPI0035A30EA5